ncbi:Protein SMG5 [Cyphomyrmex costatus]|uniref:Protein SMG5 n=1 Tax=Cyphomyrmex costatus TaxID=456900 RepID=A0A195CAQ5_9HYME|nr:Protein SMG5 [Cyphomyrmex costatus]
MRRSYNAAVEARSTDCLEVTRRLHKSVTEIVKKLDEQKNRALTVSDIFVPSGKIQRMKLKDYCERLLLKDPIGNVHKIEELLWRKAFYDVVYTAKKLRKGNTWNDIEKTLLSVHLVVGVGYYHHLIMRLQTEYDLDLVGIVDFAFIQNESISSYARTKTGQLKTHTKELKQCVMRLIHRSLVCLGDLSRYKLELNSNWDPMIANRYYKMAIAIDPNIGMPHNQLGTIAGNKNYGLDAVYHYMRSVLCPEPFEGAEGNLKKIVVTQSTYTDESNSVHHCVSRLFSLLRLWDYENPNFDKINQECQDLLNDIEKCLTMDQIEPNNTNSLENIDNIETYLQNCKNRPTLYLTDDMVFKIVTICLMSISRLKTKESNEVQGVVAITLAILSQLLEFIIRKLQEMVIEIAVPDVEATVKGNTYCSKLKNAQKNQALYKSGDNGNHVEEKDSIFSKDNNVLNLDETNKIKSSDNGITNKSGPKKTRNKSKSLLSKLRRRKRKTSSDSDASDVEQSTLASSSDEINSDVSETEEDDALSEGNDALSDDNTDDEERSPENKIQTIENTEQPVKEEMNGHGSDIANKTENCDKNGINHLVNGQQHATDQQTSSKALSDKDSVINSVSSSAVTVTNTDSSSTFEEGNDRLCNADNIFYMAQLKKQSLKSNDILDILIDKEILVSIKVCFDWLRSNPDIIRKCAKSSRTLLKRVTILLNLINMDIETLVRENEDSSILSSVEKLKEYTKIVPLPEDIDLRGLNLLENAHKTLNWQILRKHKIYKREEILLRVLKLIEFGHHLCSVENSKVQYDQTEQLFIVTDENSSNAPKVIGLDKKIFGVEHSKQKLMKHMGKLWLNAEVRALESQVQSRLMSPYLVPDHKALSKHMPYLKRLVEAKLFVVVIPSVAVSALDEVKRVSPQAREAMRWIEMQLKCGSRFVRAQRPHERLAPPLITEPKPKDKEAWLFFQIMECCYYLTQEAKAGFTGDGEVPVVTLLTGCKSDDRTALDFSLDGLAESAGNYCFRIFFYFILGMLT